VGCAGIFPGYCIKPLSEQGVSYILSTASALLVAEKLSSGGYLTRAPIRIDLTGKFWGNSFFMPANTLINFPGEPRNLSITAINPSKGMVEAQNDETLVAEYPKPVNGSTWAMTMLSNVLYLNPSGIMFAPGGTLFFHVLDAGEKDWAVYKWNEQQGKWMKMDVKSSPGGQILIYNATSFSSYVVMAPRLITPINAEDTGFAKDLMVIIIVFPTLLIICFAIGMLMCWKRKFAVEPTKKPEEKYAERPNFLEELSGSPKHEYATPYHAIGLQQTANSRFTTLTELAEILDLDQELQMISVSNDQRRYNETHAKVQNRLEHWLVGADFETSHSGSDRRLEVSSWLKKKDSVDMQSPVASRNVPDLGSPGPRRLTLPSSMKSSKKPVTSKDLSAPGIISSRDLSVPQTLKLAVSETKMMQGLGVDHDGEGSASTRSSYDMDLKESDLITAFEFGRISAINPRTSPNLTVPRMSPHPGVFSPEVMARRQLPQVAHKHDTVETLRATTPHASARQPSPSFTLPSFRGMPSLTRSEHRSSQFDASAGHPRHPRTSTPPPSAKSDLNIQRPSAERAMEMEKVLAPPQAAKPDFKIQSPAALTRSEHRSSQFDASAGHPRHPRTSMPAPSAKSDLNIQRPAAERAKEMEKVLAPPQSAKPDFKIQPPAAKRAKEMEKALELLSTVFADVQSQAQIERAKARQAALRLRDQEEEMLGHTVDHTVYTINNSRELSSNDDTSWQELDELELADSNFSKVASSPLRSALAHGTASFRGHRVEDSLAMMRLGGIEAARFSTIPSKRIISERDSERDRDRQRDGERERDDKTERKRDAIREREEGEKQRVRQTATKREEDRQNHTEREREKNRGRKRDRGRQEDIESGKERNVSPIFDMRYQVEQRASEAISKWGRHNPSDISRIPLDARPSGRASASLNLPQPPATLARPHPVNLPSKATFMDPDDLPWPRARSNSPQPHSIRTNLPSTVQETGSMTGNFGEAVTAHRYRLPTRTASTPHEGQAGRSEESPLRRTPSEGQGGRSEDSPVWRTQQPGASPTFVSPTFVYESGPDYAISPRFSAQADAFEFGLKPESPASSPQVRPKRRGGVQVEALVQVTDDFGVQPSSGGRAGIEARLSPEIVSRKTRRSSTPPDIVGGATSDFDLSHFVRTERRRSRTPPGIVGGAVADYDIPQVHSPLFSVRPGTRQFLGLDL
jgi:hypothetical protein